MPTLSPPRPDGLRTTPVRTAEELAGTLRLAVMRLSRRMRRERDEFLDLPAPQVAALLSLQRFGPMAPHELAARELVRPPSMTRTLARLEDRGLAARTPHPTDGRQVIVALTDAGTALLKEERRRRDAWLARRLRELTPREREILRAAAPVLEKLSDA